MNLNIKNINNIINHIKSVKNGTHKKQGICVLIGAGADISSGGILFRELKIRFLKENGCIIPTSISDKNLDEKFEKNLVELSQDGRCETLDKIMRKHKKPSEGYSLLVMLAEMGYIDSVITTNFDYLLEETQDLLNLKPFTIYTPGRAIPEEYYLQRKKIPPIYLKMHGDLFDRLVTHLTRSEIRSKHYGEKFINLFTHIIQNNSIIIVGYGGYDDLITEVFRQQKNDIDGVYWCNICNPKEDSDLVKTLEQENKLWYVQTTFDNLFQELAKNLLKDAILKNANPIFLPTVIQAKIENQKYIFNEKVEYSDKLINRIDAQNALEDMLQTFDIRCIAITGEPKFGKSCFIYKAMRSIQDITFFPIMCEHNHSILSNMVQALGYDTDVPFSIMYSFLKWWNDKQEHLVVIMDDFFNQDYFQTTDTKYIIEFFNLLYIARGFKYIQFIVTFQYSVYNEIIKNNAYITFGEILSHPIELGKFSEDEVEKLLNKFDAGNNVNELRKKELLYIPYVWEIIFKNNILLTDNTDFFAQYINGLFNIATKNYNFTKHAFNKMLRNLSYNQIFSHTNDVDIASYEFKFLQQEGIIDINNNIIYPELAVYYCMQYFLQSLTWEEVIFKTIIPEIQKSNVLSDIQIEVYVSIWTNVNDIDSFNVILSSLEYITKNSFISMTKKKLIIKILQRCIKENNGFFVEYLTNIDINEYSIDFQKYLFKVCAELSPKTLTVWENCNSPSILSYAAFILRNDDLYRSLILLSMNPKLEIDLSEEFTGKNGLIKLLHIMTYFGWDNLSNAEYLQLKNIMISKLIPVVKTNDMSIQYSVDVLINYAYNVFFNAGEDFEEQFIRCKNATLNELTKKVLSKQLLTEDDYMSLIEINIDINNSWQFIISNLIVIYEMYNFPAETYDMLYHCVDNMQYDVHVQYLDFFLSSTFWSLYLNKPCNREMFTEIFEKVVEKYERILFMFPNTKRTASFNKFSDEFDRMFEDGFNPIAFYFYTAPYKSLTMSEYKWNNGNNDLKVYWDLAKYMTDLGKFDEVLRIVHALGQMISIYPDEGYSALENLTKFDQPIIKRGIIRIFKENCLRYSRITKEKLRKSLFNFDTDDIEQIVYNADFSINNRTLEQLHWARLFYNMEQYLNINTTELFLKNILNSQSCSVFIHDFINDIFLNI